MADNFDRLQGGSGEARSVRAAVVHDLEANARLYKQQRDELLAALEPVAEIAAELEAKGYFDDCSDEAMTFPNDVELSVADLRRCRRAAERVRKGQ